jgi:hypothetical protein
MSLLVLVIFWVGTCFSFRTLGFRTGLVFAGLWIIGAFVFAACHLQPFLFVAYEALLAVVLFILLQREWT